MNHGYPKRGAHEKGGPHGRAGTSETDAQMSGGLSRSENGPSGGTSDSLRMGAMEKRELPRRLNSLAASAIGIECTQAQC